AIAVVEDDRLSRRHRRLRLSEGYLCTAVRRRCDNRSRARVPIADFRGALDRIAGRIDQPVNARCHKPIREQLLRVANNHLARFRNDVEHEPPLTGCNPESLTLADREPLPTLVPATHT